MARCAGFGHPQGAGLALHRHHLEDGRDGNALEDSTEERLTGGAGGHLQQRRHAQGLGQVVEGALGEGFFALARFVESRHQHHGHMGILLGDAIEQFEAPHLGHSDVGDHHRHGVGSQPLQRGESVGCREDLQGGISFLHRFFEGGEKLRVVVHDENDVFAGRSHQASSFRRFAAGFVIGG